MGHKVRENTKTCALIIKKGDPGFLAIYSVWRRKEDPHVGPAVTALKEKGAGFSRASRGSKIEPMEKESCDKRGRRTKKTNEGLNLNKIP